MRINVFAGARRIALLITVLAVIGTVAGLATTKTFADINVQVDDPQAPFVVTEEKCPDKSATRSFNSTIDGGRVIGVNLCLKAMDFQGVLLVPYKIDADGIVYGAAPHSSEVVVYSMTLERRFQLSQADLKDVKKIISKQDMRPWKEGLFYLALGLAIFWAAVWGIGWIARGFAGIQPGKDHRQSGSDS